MGWTRGCTLLEVLVAATLVAMAGAIAGAAVGASLRAAAAGRRAERVANRAERRLLDLRDRAAVTRPRCQALGSGDSSGAAMTERWTVELRDSLAAVRLVIASPIPLGQRQDTFATLIRCR